MVKNFDAIVIGAGAMGSAAAYYLSKSGASVLLIEQFELDHRRGSSYGHSRIIRFSYHKTDYIALAKPNYELWTQLEQEAGERLLIKTGGIDFGFADSLSLQGTLDSMNALSIPYESLSPQEANQRFPQYDFHEGMHILYQADSGMLRASAAVKAHVRLAQQQGAIFQAEEPVHSISTQPDSVTVTTAKGTYSAGKLVVTAGAWASRLLEQTGITLPFETLRCQLCFFEPGENAPLYDVSQMPVFIYHRSDDVREAMYGLPSYDGSGVKAAFNGGEPKEHPENVDYEPSPETVQRVRDGVGDHLPVVKQGKLLETRICLYTQTPDSDFVIDRHPQYDNIIIGGGFSGHGFKFSTIIGNILSDLALHGQTPHGIDLFRIGRFV